MFDPNEYDSYLDRVGERLTQGLAANENVHAILLNIYQTEMKSSGMLGILSCGLLERRCAKLANEIAVGARQHTILFIALFLEQLYLVKLRHKVSAEIAQQMIERASKIVEGCSIIAAARQLSAERSKG